MQVRKPTMLAARSMIMLCLALGVVSRSATADERPATGRLAAGGVAKDERTCRECTLQTTGIACQPTPVVCRVPLASPTDAQGGGELH